MGGCSEWGEEGVHGAGQTALLASVPSLRASAAPYS